MLKSGEQKIQTMQKNITKKILIISKTKQRKDMKKLKTMKINHKKEKNMKKNGG
jgi:plasmid maintenance system killer protein